MQPKQRSRHSRFPCNSLGNNGLYNLLNFGARVVIELRVEVTTMVIIVVTETKWRKGKERKSYKEKQRLGHDVVKFVVLSLQHQLDH